MRRTAYPPRRQVVSVVVGWLLLGLAPLVPWGAGAALLFGAFGAMIVWLTLAVSISRASLTDGRLRLRALRRRDRLDVNLDEVVRYATDREGHWWVETADRRSKVPVEEPWTLHAAMADLAPQALAPKRLRPQHLPPPEDLRGLWTYDVEGLLSGTIGRTVAIVALVALTHRAGVAYGLILGPLIFGLPEMGGRLDVTRDGLVRRGPFHRRSILWEQAQAIFCESPLARRRFVVTGAGTAIEIPAHLASDPELMRKVFRSLPEGTLCVNFDETTFRGYRRRKKAKDNAPQEELMPALTA